MVLRDHASLVTHSNHMLVGITVIKPSQRRIRPTMLALTSHYSATNAKHPRYAPGLSPESMTRCDHWARYWCEKSFAAELGVVVGSLSPDQGFSDPRSLPPLGGPPQPSRQPRRTRPRQPGQSLSVEIPLSGVQRHPITNDVTAAGCWRGGCRCGYGRDGEGWAGDGVIG